MPGTFGNTSVGTGGHTSLGEPFKRTSMFAAPDCGVEKLTVYLEKTGTVGTARFKGLIYADEGGKPGKKIAVSNEITFANTDATGWKDLTFAAPVGLLAGNYWIGLINGGAEGIAFFYWFNVANGRARNLDETEATITSTSEPLTYGEAVFDEKQISVYATYGAAPAPTITNPGAQSSERDLGLSLPIKATMATSYSASGLPPGLSMNTSTGVISGTPTTIAGAVSVTVKATGPGGSAEVSFNWTITAGTKFGNGAIGVATSALGTQAGSNLKRVNRVKAPGCQITKLSAYLSPSGVVGTQKLKMVMYAHNPVLNQPGAKLAVSEERTFTNGGFAAGWFDFTLATPIVQKSGTYWIGFIASGTENVCNFFYTEVGETCRAFNVDETEATTGGSNPFGECQTDAHQMSVTATYEAAPPPTFTQPANQSSEQNTYVWPAFQLVFTNVESFSATGLPAGMGVNANGEVTGKPTEAPAAHTVKITAEGINGTNIERTFTWTVVAASPSYNGWSSSNPPPAGSGRPGSSTSPFNTPVGPNPPVLANSAAMIAFMLEKNPNSPKPIHSNTEGPRPLFFAKNSDPLVEVKRNPFGEAKKNPPSPLEGRKIRVPAAMKPSNYANPPPKHNELEEVGGSDRHATIVLAPADAIEPGEIFDLYQVFVEGSVLWFTNGGAATWTGSLIALQPASGNAAGFLDNAGQVTVAELKAGVVPHALVVDAAENRHTFVYPATHTDGDSNNVNAQPMGQRFYLNYTVAEIEALNFAPWKQGILIAMVTYGFYITDSGSAGLYVFTEGGELMYEPFTGEEPLRAVAEEQITHGDGSIINEGPYFSFHLKEGIDWTRLVAIGPPGSTTAAGAGTLNHCDVFPPGTVVGAWPIDARQGDQRPAGKPVQTVVSDAAGSLALQLEPAEYVLWGEPSGKGRAIVLALAG